jgi:hypothetical protein
LESSALQRERRLGRWLGRLGLESPVGVVIDKRIPEERRWNG